MADTHPVIDNSLLDAVARLCGDITLPMNSDPSQVVKLQQEVASTLICEQAPDTSGLFNFEQLENFTVHQLAGKDLEQLKATVKQMQETNRKGAPVTRVFRREVPFVSSQVKGSVPAWARGAYITNSIGPLLNNDGRRFWFDFYKVIPLVQVSLQGAPAPFLLLPLEVSTRPHKVAPTTYAIPKGSVWIKATVFTPSAPDNLFCGLAISGGELKFSAPTAIDSTNKISAAAGVTVTVHLDLEQKSAPSSPGNFGTDAREAMIELPKTLDFSYGSSGTTITGIGVAGWTLYDQAVQFTWDKPSAVQWNPVLNRILLPFKTDVSAFIVNKCKSTVCLLKGKAPISGSFWALNAAAIDISAPLQADGTGAMGVVVKDGLEAAWPGLKDANLHHESHASLKNALVMLMPGRINIGTLFASNPAGKQRYKLWNELPALNGSSTQFIDLSYTKQFSFFFDCLSSGVESIVAQANCTNSVNRPVQADGAPFKVESLQTVFALSMSKHHKVVMLYDDNIILDNWQKSFIPKKNTPPLPVTFISSSVALNNALLTVSPVSGMLLYGDLRNGDTFEKCLLIYSFGLLQYLPTLPDPYAANISFFKRRIAGREGLKNLGKVNQQNTWELSSVHALLVCLMKWKSMDEPDISFFLGDKPAGTVQPYALKSAPKTGRADAPKQGIVLGSVTDRDLLTSIRKTNQDAARAIQVRSWNSAMDNQKAAAAMADKDTAMYIRSNSHISEGEHSPFLNSFALLDVSTNADLMGVSVGFANDDFVFRKTHMVKESVQGNPISINGMDVQAASRFVRIFTLPQISWEPVINISEVSSAAKDPWPGLLYFLNDGVPAQIANTGVAPVSISPIPLTNQVANWYNNKSGFAAWGYFTLPYGMLALAMYYKDDPANSPVFDLIRQKFTPDIFTALQIKTVGLYDDKNRNRKFFGSAHQLPNAYNAWFPATGARSILSGSVTEIFNDEFGTLSGFDPDKYVPLERYDFSGYGANVFSHWVNENAALSQTSQAMFDVWRGRTAHEVIQVKSVIYPWGIRVVRTITIYRGSNAFEWRTDSGWKAESDGIYDFRTPIKDDPAIQPAIDEEKAHDYKFHPGMVDGVFNVRNIKEDDSLSPFDINPWQKKYGVYIDNQGHTADVGGGKTLDVHLVPVFFDADVQIDDVVQGAGTDKRVVSRRMMGYLQLRPRGVFIDAEDFAALLLKMQGLGGPVDCTLNINKSKQQMRITRVEVNPGKDASGNRVFVAAAKGTPVLPKDGSWSVVRHDAGTKEVLPLKNNDVIPLVRDGIRNFIAGTLDYNQDKVTHAVNVSDATELFRDLESRTQQYGFLISTGENKVLFRNPLFEKGVDVLKGSIPDFADAYRLMNSKGIFPKLEDLPKIDKLASDFEMKIRDEGYKLLNKLDPSKILEQVMPAGPWYIVKTEAVKVYVDYKPTKPDGSDAIPGAKSVLDLDIDSTARSWVNKMNDVTMAVDLGPFTRLLIIRGKFDTAKGSSPSFKGPEMEFGPDLKPVYDILVLLSTLSTGSYADILAAGLKIAMSNSPNNWEYKFQADKEIPIIKFPPPELDTAASPLRLEAGLKAGVYFNVALPIPPVNGIPMPSAGAYVEFYGKLSVMCVSVGLGSIYAVGQVTVRMSADTAIGPALYMKFGFGVEAVVALPVIGSVSVYFAVGVEMSLDSTQITIGAFVLFKGRAEILGGIVTVTIQIEASGKVQSRLKAPDPKDEQTTMIAQVTFSLDISICWIINISFSESWEEQRQIS
jgi:hypothetical protein